jgi:hypothetical protein
MAKKSNKTDPAAEFLKAQGVDPGQFEDVAGLDKLTPDQIKEIAKKASAGDPEARKIAERLVEQGRMEAVSTPVGKQFAVPAETKVQAVGNKPETGTPITKVEQMEAQQELQRATAKKKAAAKPGVEVPAPDSGVEARKEAKQARAAEGKKLAESRELEGIAKKPPANAAEAVRAQNFKKGWQRLAKDAQDKMLLQAFGPKVASLEPSIRAKLGELAMAEYAIQKSGMTTVPDWDDVQASIKNIEGRLRQPSVDVKGITSSVSIAHGKALNPGGTLKTQMVQLRKPRAGEIGSAKIGETPVAKPKPDLSAEEVSPGFETAKRAQVPANVKNAMGKKSMDKFSREEAAAPAAAAAPTPTPAAAETPAAAAAAADSEATARSKKYREATQADPKKYGEGSGLKASSSWTPEQKAARAELRKTLGYPDKFVRRPRGEAAAPAAAPAAAEAAPKTKRITMTDEEKKAWGKAVGADKTKYGKSKSKATPAQLAARDELAAKIVAGRKTAPAAAAAAATPAPAASTPAPSAPAAPTAPTAPTAPAAAATASTLPNPYGAKGKGPWKPNPARDTAMLKERAKKMGFKGAKGLGKAAGVMRFLGPLAAIYGGYQLLDLLKQGTMDEADERRLKAMQALGAVGGGMMQDIDTRSQVQQMQRMVDFAAIQRQKSRDEMQAQFLNDQALNSLLAGQQASLAALAQPSRPSIAEMMARM